MVAHLVSSFQCLAAKEFNSLLCKLLRMNTSQPIWYRTSLDLACVWSSIAQDLCLQEKQGASLSTSDILLSSVSLWYFAEIFKLGTYCHFDMFFDHSICRPFLHPSTNEGREPRWEYDEVGCSTFKFLKVSTICIDWSTGNLFIAQRGRRLFSPSQYSVSFAFGDVGQGVGQAAEQ